MIRTIRRTAAALLALLMLGMTPVYAVTDEEKVTQSKNQITNVGGSAGSLATDGVEVSKTIAPTGIENYFDITLTAKTQMTYDKKQVEDAHVVIVLDMSNTMLDKIEADVTRYDAAMGAVDEFVNGFVKAAASSSNANRMIGVAAFNTNGHKIVELSSATTEDEGSTIKSTVGSKTKAILDTEGPGIDNNGVEHEKIEYNFQYSRFTNMEAGLKVAYDMLKDSGNVANKMIIFITDGFPTTYLKSESTYEGYNPYCSTGTPGTDGIFSDAYATYKTGKITYCTAGTSYSNKAAIQARRMATTIKNDGIKIYSVGVDLGGQSIANYENRFYGENEKNLVKNAYLLSVIDIDPTDKEEDIAKTDRYEITREDLKKWLEGTDKNGGIGSGKDYYKDVASTNGFKEVLGNLVGNVGNPVGVGSTALSTTDPVTVNDTSDDVAFVGFYDKAGTSSSTYSDGKTVLSGSSVQWSDSDAENTADCTKDGGGNDVINWKLENSAYTETTAYRNGNDKGDSENWTTKTVTRTYTLRYRVRLENEKSGFKPGEIYNTNGETTLTYTKTDENGNTIKDSNGNTVKYEIDYLIPQVKGYLGSLSFTKVDSYTNQPLSGATFTLAHDGEGCEVCKGGVEIKNVTATSDGNGRVEFTNIPSGHTYTLSETVAAPYHHKLNESYAVTVAYGGVTVEEKGEKVEGATTHFSRDDGGNITITNDTVLPGDVEVTLTKMVNGSTPGFWLDGTFKFSLTDNDTGEVKSTSAVGGSAAFVLNYKGAGKAEYTYTLREVKGGGRYYYDSTVYTVVVTLTDDGTGDYKANIAYYKGEVGADGTLGERVAGATFNNITRSTHTHTKEEVPPVPEEIPKSGGMSGLGLVIGLMAAAAVVSRKRRK